MLPTFQQVRRGIRAVQERQDPQGVSFATPELSSRTYCNDTVAVPPATADEDRAVMRRTGRALAEAYLSRPVGA